MSRGNGNSRKKPDKIILGANAWEASLMRLVGDGITNGISESHMIAALEKAKLGLIMAHTVSTVERRAKKSQ